jgi:DNA-binding NarL/FixJ family response regulator/anti-sigma regulatory factor (Ser/Thr protein kinase)
MPIILVVDDSPFDRLLTGRLLAKEKELDWVIEYAENGREALAFMEDVVPHVVVTDLMMPEVDGLELVAAMRASHPEVPVILVTGQGSETLAMEALQRGAASYVPKGQLADKLSDTVKQVLAVARADSRYQRLTECFVKSQLAVELDNDPALISPLVDLVQKMLTDMRFCDAAERVHVGMALEEALLNAFCHGTLALPPEQVQQARAELSQGRVAPCIQDRWVHPSCRDRKVFVEAQIGRNEARFVVRDEGAGFAHAAIPERHDPTTMERGQGRGLVLMRHFMDEVAFNDKGNEVTLVKYRTQRMDEEG